MEVVHGQPSWQFASDSVNGFVTRLGGHMAPVRFRLGDRWVQPYAVAPWAEEELSAETPPILKALRGDFFCLPFGDKDPPHGETCNREWEQVSEDGGSVQLAMRLIRPAGRVTKRLWTHPGETIVYSEHVIEGVHGRFPVGHHPTLHFRSPGLIATSPILGGHTFPGLFESEGRSALRPESQFHNLQEVPLATGGHTDLTRYPAREGFEDLVLLKSDQSLPFAWTSVTFPEEGYVWFSIKDPRLLTCTLLWHSNGGRPYAPWNGRHKAVLGLEEVTAYFDLGVEASLAPNPVNQSGTPTCLLFDGAPLRIPFLQGVAQTPAGFGHVTSIRRESGLLCIEDGEREVRIPFNDSLFHVDS